MRAVRGGLVAVLAALGLLAGCIGDAASAAPLSEESPSAVLATALAALEAGESVHIAISTTTSQGTVTCSDEATADGGWHVLTTETGGHVSIVLIGTVGYVAGNAAGLVSLMQVPGPEAHLEAGQWVAVRPGQQVGASSYDYITGGITLSSVASQVTPTGPLTLTGPVTVDGQQVIGVQGRAPASMQLAAGARATLYVATSDARPVRYEVSGGSGYFDQVTFGNWGQRVVLVVPPHAIPATQLQTPRPT
ncbi:MAG TPA: hypothetical protein VMG38_10710 [Trebonia sp.]|nr:hypothetical protein [Trebonia sp.]